MYARPQSEDGAATTFGVSGKLWRDALIMYDRQSRSLWSQVDGEAKAGPLAGQRLVKMPSQVTTWAAWKRRHPSTLVLAKPALEKSPYASYFDSSWVGLPWTRGGRDDRLQGKTLVLGVDLQDGPRNAALAVELEQLRHRRLLSGEVEGRPVMVVAPGDPRAAQAYLRRLGDRVLDFELSAPDDADSYLIDRQTLSRWSWETGEALSGPLAGGQLTPLPATPIYWTTWVSFHPQSQLWPADP